MWRSVEEWWWGWWSGFQYLEPMEVHHLVGGVPPDLSVHHLVWDNLKLQRVRKAQWTTTTISTTTSTTTITKTISMSTSQSPDVRAVRETILGQRAASGLSGRLVTMLQMCWLCSWLRWQWWRWLFGWQQCCKGDLCGYDDDKSQDVL